MDVATLLALPVLGMGMPEGYGRKDAEYGVVIEDLDGVGLESVALLTFCLAAQQAHTAGSAGLVA
ncbi:hypothetical protein [Kitasatospora aureofaciens]|uniref:hypothetical protein n=1 Tax=Kitasatospora aureofaciens TaxID=1894 RepID=UPI001C45D46A|nr:hypothetical protein [Kitasatospora aureofaciens]MBV6696998.1 hypothetical protein [Kitasatospora aureofaciens]